MLDYSFSCNLYISITENSTKYYSKMVKSMKEMMMLTIKIIGNRCRLIVSGNLNPYIIKTLITSILINTFPTNRTI